MQLDERKRRILQAIVQDYIATAEPVSSRAICRRYNLGVSPATVRNEMADLEEMGYIEQPHTSAGRIPSDKGYRYYVDWLMEDRELDQAEKATIRAWYAKRMKEIEEIVSLTTQLLSRITNYTAMMLEPRLDGGKFKYLRLIPLAPTRALLLVVSTSGMVEHQLVEFSTSINPEDLERLSNELTDCVRGKSIQEIIGGNLSELQLQVTRQRQVLGEVLKLLKEALIDSHEEKVYLGGTSNILAQPEFKRADRLEALFGLFEDENHLRHLLREASDNQITVRIGEENLFDVIHDCSIVTATYRIGGRTVGTLGVLGPTRMQYSRVLPAVRYTTSVLSETLTELFG